MSASRCAIAIGVAAVGLAAGGGTAFSFTAPPAGTALVYSEFEDEQACHFGVFAADSAGQPLARLLKGPLATLTADKRGTLWASTGCRGGRGFETPPPPCVVWRAGNSRPVVTAATLRRRLQAKGLLATGETPSALLCRIYPAPGGGFFSTWENALIRVGPSGRVISVSYVTRKAAARMTPAAVTSSGRLIYSAGRDATASRVEGLGTFPGDVLDARSDGTRLVLLPGNPLDFAESDRVALERLDGRQDVVWQTSELGVEVRAAQFTSDGSGAVVRAGGMCAFCERSAFMVAFGGQPSQGQLLQKGVGPVLTWPRP
jgi:hypothetical protein